MSETTVRSDLLQALKIVTHLRVDGVGQDLRVLSVDDVLLPVQEPGGDLELGRVLHDGDDTLKLIRVEVTGALLQVNVRLLADNVGVSSTNTTNLGQRIHDLTLSIDVGVEQTQNVLELLVGLGNDQRHDGRCLAVLVF